MCIHPQLFAAHHRAPAAAMASAGWWVAAVGLPSLLARRMLRRGQEAMENRQYDAAQRYFRKAMQFEPTRAEATCLVAEVLLRCGSAQEAISALDPLFPAGDQLPAPPRRANFLLTIGYCMLRLGSAAQSEISPLMLDANTSAEERLASLQACLLAEDTTTARRVLETIDIDSLSGKMQARARICRAALFWREGHWPQALAALPDIAACDESDQFVVHTVRQLIQQRLAVEAGVAG